MTAMEMPTPCSRCGRICELNDMYADKRGGTAPWGGWPVVCRTCHQRVTREGES